MRMTCCSSEEIVRNDDDKIIKPIIDTYPDEDSNEIEIHRSASELRRTPIEDLKTNSLKLLFYHLNSLVRVIKKYLSLEVLFKTFYNIYRISV